MACDVEESGGGTSPSIRAVRSPRLRRSCSSGTRRTCVGCMTTSTRPLRSGDVDAPRPRNGRRLRRMIAADGNDARAAGGCCEIARPAGATARGQVRPRPAAMPSSAASTALILAMAGMKNTAAAELLLFRQLPVTRQAIMRAYKAAEDARRPAELASTLTRQLSQVGDGHQGVIVTQHTAENEQKWPQNAVGTRTRDCGRHPRSTLSITQSLRPKARRYGGKGPSETSAIKPDDGPRKSRGRRCT